MKRLSLILSFTVVLAFVVVAKAQESHVQVSYNKDVDVTAVTSDVLYVINMPSQFMQIQFVGRYANQGKPATEPFGVNMQIFSYAPAPVYQMDSAHRLQVKVDDQVLDFGLLNYSHFVERHEDKQGQVATVAGVRAALPANALVASHKKGDGLTMEFMTLKNPTPGDLAAIAKGNSVIMKIGNTVFPLTATQLKILREFLAAITPEGEVTQKKPVAINVPPEVPSEANKMPLDETLKWIKTALDREGSTKDPVVPRRLETLEFKTCRVRYRLVPLVRTSPVSSSLVYSIMEYQLDIGDLNPETIVASNGRDYASVAAMTRDAQAKIKIIEHANYEGSTGRTLHEGEGSFITIKMKNLEAATHLKVALTHAVSLCRDSR